MSYKYFINGDQVSKEQAERHWINSDAAARTLKGHLNDIFKHAHEDNGGENGEINWFNEAGITISSDEEQDWVYCWNCENGFSHHECGEDCCSCLYPENNVVCDVCHGKSGWYASHHPEIL